MREGTAGSPEMPLGRPDFGAETRAQLRSRLLTGGLRVDVGVHILAEQCDLAIALGGESLNLRAVTASNSQVTVDGPACRVTIAAVTSQLRHSRCTCVRADGGGRWAGEHPDACA